MTVARISGPYWLTFGCDIPAEGMPAVLLEPGTPLRLNRSELQLPDRESLAARGRPLRDLLIDGLAGMCPAWDQGAHRFLRRYFAYLEGAIERERDRIEARLAAFHGLFGADDTLFSALSPLPRAHLPVQGGDTVPVDFAFWQGDRLTAVLLVPSRLTPARARARLAALEASGITVEVDRAGGETDDGALFDRILGSRAARFFDAEPAPCGPVGPGQRAAFMRAIDAAPNRAPDTSSNQAGSPR